MKQKQGTRQSLLYMKIAGNLEQQITKGILKMGDKLPSIRMICRQQGVSMSTAQFAYYELEARSLITSRPQSGYYVSSIPAKKMAIPEITKPKDHAHEKKAETIFGAAFSNVNEKKYTLFSLGIPSEPLLPIAKLKKALVQATRDLPGGGTGYEPLQGNQQLITQIAKWSLHWQGNLSYSDIITTTGCITGISYCLMALAKRGDTIAVESPCFFGILQLVQSMGLKVIELPTSPQTGADLDALKRIVTKNKLAACILVSNFNNPFGSLMPDAHKKETVRLLAHHNVPLIEDDLYGDIYFGDHRPTCCKSYDETGMVLLCSSFSKTLAPGYRVGWVAPGKFMGEITKMKLYNSLCGTSITHEVIGSFLATGRYEAHLRQLRRKLYTNYLQYARVISESFPQGTKISRPQGGLSLWVELPKGINTTALYHVAYAKKITFSPGSLFSFQQQYHNCLRVSYGLEWNEKTEHSLQLLGKLAGNYS